MFVSTCKQVKYIKNEHTYFADMNTSYRQIQRDRKYLFIYDYGGAPACAVKDAGQGKLHYSHVL